MTAKGRARQVPRRGSQLRRQASQEQRRLNPIALRTRRRELSLAKGERRHHDLDDLAGTWVDDPEFDRAVEAIDQVDTGLWR